MPGPKTPHKFNPAEFAHQRVIYNEGTEEYQILIPYRSSHQNSRLLPAICINCGLPIETNARLGNVVESTSQEKQAGWPILQVWCDLCYDAELKRPPNQELDLFSRPRYVAVAS